MTSDVPELPLVHCMSRGSWTGLRPESAALGVIPEYAREKVGRAEEGTPREAAAGAAAAATRRRLSQRILQVRSVLLLKALCRQLVLRSPRVQLTCHRRQLILDLVWPKSICAFRKKLAVCRLRRKREKRRGSDFHRERRATLTRHRLLVLLAKE